MKVGILLSSYEVPAWVYDSIKRVFDSDAADISLVILKKAGSSESGICGNRSSWKLLVYSSLTAIDELLFRRSTDAFGKRDLRQLLAGVPSLAVTPILQDGSARIRPGDVDRIKAHCLDILINMGFGPLSGEMLGSAKHGVWLYDPDGRGTNSTGLAGYWEAIEDWPETVNTVRMVKEDNGTGDVLFRSWTSTYRFSPYRNRSYCFWKSSTFLSRQIELLHRLGEGEYFQRARDLYGVPDCSDDTMKGAPSNLVAAWHAVHYFARLVFGVYEKAFKLNVWRLMFALTPDDALSIEEFQEIVAPVDRFWADPHVVRADNIYHVFIEEYMYEDKKGRISVLELDERGVYSEPVTVLEKDYHLSYPFVFMSNGRYYMVPETRNNRTIELYECTGFPHSWKFKMNLMENVEAVDTTLYWHDGKWWLFAGMSESPGLGFDSELFIFFSEQLFTDDWKPHPLNPVISDVRNARPAGRIFARDGNIYRPSQDSSVMYGYGLNINRITSLSETDYAEERVIALRPDWDRRTLGVHSYTRDGHLTVMDAFRKERKSFRRA